MFQSHLKSQALYILSMDSCTKNMYDSKDFVHTRLAVLLVHQ